MHGTIKHIYLHGKNVKRLDKAIHAIMTFVRDKLIDRLVILHKGKVTSKISDLRHRHKKSLSMSSDLVSANDDTWDVISSSQVKEIYSVRKISQLCECKIVCDACKACIHQYVCTCIDSAIKRNMCKHIHLVCRVTDNNSRQPEDSENIGSLVIDEAGTSVNEVEMLTEALRRPKATQTCTSTSLETKKQKLLERIQKQLAEEINNIETEEEINAIEHHFALLHAILTSIRHNNGQRAEQFKADVNVCPGNKKIRPQRLFSTKKSKGKSKNKMSKPSLEESHAIATNIIIQARYSTQ